MPFSMLVRSRSAAVTGRVARDTHRTRRVIKIETHVGGGSCRAEGVRRWSFVVRRCCCRLKIRGGWVRFADCVSYNLFMILLAANERKLTQIKIGGAVAGAPLSGFVLQN